ncbi:polysaccharide deacetylase family protein [Paraclostridium bifermentans]|uniref:polysaccharide deacetylase family protein n=3 Tax=Clostridia TaxID=186801 RepID=UPI00189FA87E|nr:polysaccharide deacetylase family protein [Paraclostridium bifermentans]
MRISKLKMLGIVIAVVLVIILGIIVLNKKSNFTENDAKDYIIYDSDKAIKDALSEIKTTSKKSNILSDVNTSENVISLNFVGLSTPETNDKLVNILKQYNTKSTFFIPGILAAEDTDIFEKLIEGNHKVGSNGLLGENKMEEYTEEELVDSFIRTNEIIQKWTNRNESILLYCNSTSYTDKVLKAAYVSGNEDVVKSKYILNYRSFKSYEETLAYISKIPKGSMITVKLAGELDDTEYKKDEKPAEDMQGTIVENPLEDFDEEERLLMVVEWIVKALNELNYNIVTCDELQQYGEADDSDTSNNSSYYDSNNSKNLTSNNGSQGSDNNFEYLEPIDLDVYYTNKAEELRVSNKGKKASTEGKVYTVQPSVGYSFYGVSNTTVLQDVLNKLNNQKIKATFFITEKDIRNNEKEIKEIVDNGHELQIMLVEGSGNDYLSVAKSILNIKRYIKNNFNQDATLVRYPYEVQYSDEALEAISATGCKVIGQNLSVATTAVGKDGTIEDVKNNIFNLGNIALHKGFIVYFRMDYYNDNTIIGNLVELIKKEKVDPIGYVDQGVKHNGYSFAKLSELVTSEYVFNYPLTNSEILPEVLNKIKKGYLENIEDPIGYISNRYIGSPFAKYTESLPGFEEDEIEVLDKVGRFTDDNTIFLTFDDWGSDIAINKLLYILDKYNVKATFFVRTNHIDDNPSLLRTIALAGHDIASHSDNHILLSNTTDKKGVFAEITDKQAEAIQEDVILSYKKLQSIVGDIYVDGRPALQAYFRPPTLAVSKKGLMSVFDSGFSYVISGDFTTQDYEAKSAEELINKLKYGIVSGENNEIKITDGTILVMHMSDEAKFTAEALDTIIPYYLSQGYKFGRISDYLR